MMQHLQKIRLAEHLWYLQRHSPYYSQLFKSKNIDIRRVLDDEDLSSIPLTSKDDLQSKREQFICVKPEQLIDHVSTSGTTGKPLTISLTDKDLERLAENEYQSFLTAGIKANDTIQLMTTLDRRFMAGMAYFLGARKLGAGIIRIGNGLPELQWETILTLKPTTIICVPSFLVKLIGYAEEKKIDFRNCSVKKAICIGETIRNADFSLNNLGRKIAEKWAITLYSTYASSELATAYTECECGKGGHELSELVYSEIVDEEGKPVKTGEAGELVVTPLGVEGMPLLRYRTGDICVAHADACACGRRGLRLGPVLGRKDQKIKFRGTTLYPGAIYDILESYRGVENYQVELLSGELGTDELKVHIGINEHSKPSLSELSDTFRSRLRVVPTLSLSSPEEVQKKLFPGTNRKPLLFVDKRKGEERR